MQAENLPDERPLETWGPTDHEPKGQAEPTPSARLVAAMEPDGFSEAPGAHSASFAELWGASYPQPKSHLRAFIAAGILFVLAAIAVPVYRWLDGLGMLGAKATSFDPEAIGLEAPRSKQAEWLKDVLEAQGQAPPHLDPVAVHAPEASPASRPARPIEKGSRPAAIRRPPAPSSVEVPEPAPQSPYAALYGSSARYAAANSSPSARAAGGMPAASGSSASSAKGSVLYARLKDQVASLPAGGEVIATLTHRAKFGRNVLSAGTEMHGQVAGADASRLYVQFAFARLSDGSHLALQGTARDEQGRQGIPGTQPFDVKSAGSVGLASATRGIQAVGRELAGGVGAIMGSMIEGATDSGAAKAQRADRDENVVIAHRGTPFRIYVQAVRSGPE